MRVNCEGLVVDVLSARRVRGKERAIDYARLYQYGVFGGGLAGALIVIAAYPPARASDYVLAIIVVALVALGRTIEFRISSTSSSHLGTPALLAGALLLEPSLALLAVGLGIVVNEIALRGSRATLFNIGQSLIQVLVAVGVLQLVSWNPTSPDIDRPLHMAAAISAGVLAIGASIGLVGIRNWIANGGNFLRTIWGVMGAGHREIYLLDFSKVCIGIIAALLVSWTPLFIIFLLVPVATMSRAISRGGDLHKKLEISLHETEHNLAEAQRLARLGSWEWDPSSRRVSWSDQIYEILELAPGALRPSMAGMRRMLPQTDCDKFERIIAQVIEQRGAADLDHEIIHPDGELRYVSHRITWLESESGAGGRLVGTMHDITDRKRLEIRLRYQAYHDGLTGLPNREYLLDQLQECLAFSRCRAVIFVDLDFFKTINDSHGHETGDAVLVEVARRLSQTVGREDFVARLSGDEFTVLVSMAGPPHRVERLTTELLRVLRLPLEIDGATLQIDASAGLVYVADHHHVPSDILSEADKALYRAKGDGRGRVAIHSIPDTPDTVSASA